MIPPEPTRWTFQDDSSKLCSRAACFGFVCPHAFCVHNEYAAVLTCIPGIYSNTSRPWHNDDRDSRSATAAVPRSLVALVSLDNLHLNPDIHRPTAGFNVAIACSLAMTVKRGWLACISSVNFLHVAYVLWRAIFLACMVGCWHTAKIPRCDCWYCATMHCGAGAVRPYDLRI